MNYLRIIILGLLWSPWVLAKAPQILLGLDAQGAPIFSQSQPSVQLLQIEPQLGLRVDHDEASWQDSVVGLAGLEMDDAKYVGVHLNFDTNDHILAKAGVNMRLRQWWKNADYTDAKEPEFTIKLRHTGAQCETYRASLQTEAKAYESKCEIDMYNMTGAKTTAELQPLQTFSATRKGLSRHAGFVRAIKALGNVLEQAKKDPSHEAFYQAAIEQQTQELLHYFSSEQIAMVNQHLSQKLNLSRQIMLADLHLTTWGFKKRWEMTDEKSKITFQLDEYKPYFPQESAANYEISWKLQVPVTFAHPDSIFNFTARLVRQLIPGIYILPATQSTSIYSNP